MMRYITPFVLALMLFVTTANASAQDWTHPGMDPGYRLQYPPGLPKGAVDITYSQFASWSLTAAMLFSSEHYGQFVPTQCPQRNGNYWGVRVYVVPYIGPDAYGYKSAYGGYAPPGRCEVWIGQGSWGTVLFREQRVHGRWLRGQFCPLIGHEYSHQVLRDGSHAHTPDLGNRALRQDCLGNYIKRRHKYQREIGWNRAFHNPGRRH